MATYLQGVQDAVQGLRPPDPNLQFDAQLLATRQAKYDQAHSKLSKMYGTILNSGLSREDNIAAREEFFKLIDSDLHKIAGMDLSKDSNVSKAQNVFKQIYTNDYLVKDMVWTKHYQNQMERANGFKNCLDPEKCGGQYWEDGVKYMQYKREEFKSASQDESMSFANVDYIPYNNMIEDAIKALKESEHEISIQQQPTGKTAYVKKETGGLTEENYGSMVNLFSKLYADNPQYAEQFKVMAYNQRKDWIYLKVSDGTFKDMEEATVGYIEHRRDLLTEQYLNIAKNLEHDFGKLEKNVEAFNNDVAAGRIKPGTEAYIKGTNEKLLYNNYAIPLMAANNQVKYAQKNMYRINDINLINDGLDQMESVVLIQQEIDEVAKTLAQNKHIIEWEEDKLFMENLKFSHDLALEKKKHDYRMEEKALEADGKRAKHLTKALNAKIEYRQYKSEADSDVANFNSVLADQFKTGLDENDKRRLEDAFANADIQFVPNRKDLDKDDPNSYESTVKKILEAFGNDQTSTPPAETDITQELRELDIKIKKAYQDANGKALITMLEQANAGIEVDLLNLHEGYLGVSELDMLYELYDLTGNPGVLNWGANIEDNSPSSALAGAASGFKDQLADMGSTVLNPATGNSDVAIGSDN